MTKKSIFAWAALFALLLIGIIGIVGKSQSLPQVGLSGAQLPAVDLYALDNDNTLWRWPACGYGFHQMVKLRPRLVNELLIGMDFRPSDGFLYAVSDTGNIYQIDTTPPGRGNIVMVSTLGSRFAGGVQSLMDFNPVANALRLIGSNDQNFAVVNGNGNLAQTVQQTKIAYAQGDVNAGIDPNLCGGAYTNNYVGAPNTIFYGLDYQFDILVTIAPGANGSSATGGGQLTTIGRLLRSDGNPIHITPTADCDIYTDPQGNNLLIGLSGRTLFTLNPLQITPGQDVTVRAITLPNGGFVDIAVKATNAGANN